MKAYLQPESIPQIKSGVYRADRIEIEKVFSEPDIIPDVATEVSGHVQTLQLSNYYNLPTTKQPNAILMP